MLKHVWGKHPLVAAVVMLLAAVAIIALIWPITDLIAAHDVGPIAGVHRAASLQAAREAARTQLLTLGAGVFAAGALVYTARNFTLSRSTFQATEIRVLNERFLAITAQLGDDQASVRLAGVHAMAGLADDWVENRQTCVDVLCACLRMPYEPDPGPGAPASDLLAFRANREVRHTIIRVVTLHLRPEALTSWGGLNLDFTGVQFDGGDFTDAQFSGGTVRFSGAQFSGGMVDFTGAQFSGGMVDFTGAKISGGTLGFAHARFSDGTVRFDYAQFSGRSVRFHGAKFSGGTVRFTGAQFSRNMVRFDNTQFCGASVDFTGVKILGGSLRFGDAQFSGGTVDFTGMKIFGGSVRFGGAQFSGGTVCFGRAQLSGGTVYLSAKFSAGAVTFPGAKFSGASVRFHGARFSGGAVDLSSPNDWSHPPTFDFTGNPPSGLELPIGWTP
jgi:uncharacterized protein YjbI with pentapeptide repeats